MDAIDGTGEIVAEPDWTRFLKVEAERENAHQHWVRLTREMREREILSPANEHALFRLVMTYIVHERASTETGKSGSIQKPRRGNTKAIARVSPNFTVMKESGAIAASIEAELGLGPRARKGVGKVERRTRRATGADSYLKPRLVSK